jgi:O-antigen/teichoic acid export membrane protein
VHLIRRNLAWLLVSQFSTWALAILLLLVVPHRLGDEAFGQLSFAVVYVGFFELVAIFGTATYVMKTVARDHETVGQYVINAVALKAIVATILSAVAIGLAVVLQFEHIVVVLIAIGCLGMFFNALTNGFLGGLQGLQRMRGPAVADVARAYVGGIAGLIILYSGGTLTMLALATALSCAIPLVVNARSLWPQVRNHRTIDLRLWKLLIRGGLPFFMWAALSQFYGTIDIPLLHMYSDDQTVGWYALAYRWVSMPVFFASVVGTAFLPALSADMKQLPESFIRLGNRALQLVMIVSTPAAVGIALIANDFLRLLYGGQFVNAVPIMQILALQIPIISMDIVLGTVIIAADRQRQWVIVGLVAAIFNPLLNVVAIPAAQSMFGNAAIGAAAVTVVTELILMAGALILRPAGVLDGATAGILLRISLASAAMIPVVLALGPAPLAVKVGTGIVVYGVASLALRTTSLREVNSFALGSVRRTKSPTGSNSPTGVVV